MDFFNTLKFFLVGPFPVGAVGGIAINIFLALLTMAAGFLLGFVLALGRISKSFILRKLCTILIETVRATPLMLLVFWFYFIVPLFASRPMPILFSAFLSISLYSAVNQAEIFRTGFANVDKGQWQAASSTGLSKLQCMVYVIIPQVLRNMLPSLVGFFISLFKDTSVVTIIGIIDLTHVGLMLSQRNPSFLLYSYLIMALMFFVCCFALSRLAKKLEKKQYIR
ncbi:MAG: amino acid ABC transporter permease [Oscillospiraceae bacterium]|nr:amino acid ABC transporter permease [Oscillospiraceae bacterium]